jgi:cytochrome c biogenesis protein CcdA
MTSLNDVYDGGVGTVVDRRRRLLGAGVFALGAVLVVAAIPVATTGLGELLGLGTYEAREVAGVLAGVGLPAVFVGIFTVLPAPRPVRAAAVIGASVALFGVALFTAAYPDRWISVDPALTVAAILVYSLGTLVTFWCLFVGVATFKTRNDPGGTARVAVTEAGTVRIVSDTASGSGLGGLGGIGVTGTPDGEVETQTNRPTGDGGTVADPGAEPEVPEAAARRGRPDAYCGNCAHFQYVRADGDLAPYCGLHEEVMADMDACEQWESNS